MKWIICFIFWKVSSSFEKYVLENQDIFIKSKKKVMSFFNASVQKRH